MHHKEFYRNVEWKNIRKLILDYGGNWKINLVFNK